MSSRTGGRWPRARRALVCLVLGTVLVVIPSLSGRLVQAQSAPDTVTLAPGQTHDLLRPSGRVPGTTIGIPLTNAAQEPAMVTYHPDYNLLMVALPPDAIIDVTVAEAFSGRRTACPRVPRAPQMAHCLLLEVRGGSTITITDGQPPLPPTEDVLLGTGCSPVMLTWPDVSPLTSVPLTVVVASTVPAEAINAIWAFNADSGRYDGWSPLAPLLATDFFSLATSPQAVVICTQLPATLTRPLA